MGSTVLEPRTQARSSRRAAPTTGRKRTAAAAQLVEEDEEEQPQQPEEQDQLLESPLQPSTAVPGRRSQRQGAGQMMASLLAAEAAENESGVAAARALPLRATATSSPAGKRRSAKAARLFQLADVAAVEAEAAEDVAAVPGGWAGADMNGIENMFGRDHTLRAGGAGCLLAPWLLPGGLPVGNHDSTEHLVAIVFVTSLFAAQVAPHLQATRAAVMAAQEKRAERVRNVRRSNGVPKNFAVGDAVLFRAPKRGRVGRSIGPKKIICRVVKLQRFHGMTKFKLRCAAGVIKGYQFAGHLDAAPAAAAAKLPFDGVEVDGVPEVSLDKAWAAETGASVTTVCRCRGKCGNACSCKKAGVLCSRSCGCQACKGDNCGNHNH